MTTKTDESAAEDPVIDDFATRMPSWMPDAEAEGAGAADEDAAPDDGPDEAASGLVTLPPKARLPQIEDIVDQLTAAIDADDLVIDARQVEDITTPVVTAIISAMNSRAGRTPPAAVLAPTPAFVDAFSDLGLFQDLMKMEFRQ